MKEALPVVDAQVRRWIERAIRETNRHPQCDVVRLRKNVQAKLTGKILSPLENWADDAKSLDRFRPAISKSIYRRRELLPPLILSNNIRLNGVYIGVDKLGHFMNQGAGYWSRISKTNNIESGFRRGEILESGVFGVMASGIRSYADLAANAAGYEFWSHLLDGENPLVRCDQKTKLFVVNKQFTFSDYVDAAWDEAINCSEYRPRLGVRVRAELAARGVSCPIDVEACRRLLKKPHADRLISPQCHFAARSDPSVQEVTPMIQERSHN